MLGKLLKYDLKKLLKFICVFYAITLIISVFTRIFINTETPFIAFLIGRILSGTLISLFASIIINCFMRLWIKSFALGIYGDEGYLTNTLPVTRTKIYFSKFLTAVIIAFLSVAVIAATAFIAYYTDERWQVFKQMFFTGKVAGLTVMIILTFFLEFVNFIQCGYTGIILGHRMNTGKAGFSVLFAFIVETASQLAVLAFTAAAGLVNGSIMKLFTTQNPEIGAGLFAVIIPIYLIVIAADAFINVKLLGSGVNVE